MSDDEAAKPTISADMLERNNATVGAMKYPFRQLSKRDDAYILLYAQAAKLGRTGTGNPFTLRDIVNVTPDGNNRNPYYDGSNKATDSGAMERAIKAGRVAETGPGEYELTKLGAEDARRVFGEPEKSNAETRSAVEDTRPAGAERDGISYERKGEGPNHEALRLWVEKNPHRVDYAYADFETKTEVVLDSADRVDVVYCGPASIIVIEVKSLDSNDEDLRRGIFQCIKYRAVREAMDKPSNTQVIPVLVTRRPLPGDLVELARHHNIQHFKAPRKVE